MFHYLLRFTTSLASSCLVYFCSTFVESKRKTGKRKHDGVYFVNLIEALLHCRIFYYLQRLRIIVAATSTNWRCSSAPSTNAWSAFAIFSAMTAFCVSVRSVFSIAITTS